jgi:uncharacterized protein
VAVTDFQDNELAALLLKRPDSVDDLISELTVPIYANLRTAVELGKWESGSRLSAEQLEYCMQILILYQAQHLPEEQRTGAQLNERCASGQTSAEIQVLRIGEQEDKA